MIKQLVVLSQNNLYISKRVFSEWLSSALLKKGIEVKHLFIPQLSADGLELLPTLRALKPQLTCSFNVPYPDEGGEYFYDTLGIPHWFISLDPAPYFFYLCQSPRLILSTVDQGDSKLLKERYLCPSFFFPHAISADIPLSTSERPIDALFLGSCYDYERLRQEWPLRYSAAVCEALEAAAFRLLTEVDVSLFEAVTDALGSSTEEVDVRQAISDVDYYARGRDRVALIRGLKGMRVTVCGDHLLGGIKGVNTRGWDYYVGECSHVEFLTPRSFQEVAGLMGQAKVCLNSSPFFKSGSHERPLMALLSGAAVLSSVNRFWPSYLTEEDGLHFYHHGQWDAARATLSSLLDDEEMRLAQVLRGRDKVLRQFTWDALLPTALEFLSPLV